MNQKFIRLQELSYGTTIIVNIENIACVWEESSTIIVSGNHGEGNGLFYLTKESHNRLLLEIEKRMIQDE